MAAAPRRLVSLLGGLLLASIPRQTVVGQASMAQYKEHVEKFRDMIKDDPENATLHADLSMLLRVTGDTEQSEAVSRHAIKLDPKTAGAHHNLGLLSKMKDDMEASEKAFRRAIKADPAHAASYNALGELYRDQQDWAKAEKSFRKAVTINPRLSLAYNNLGLVLETRGDLLKTEDAYRQSVVADVKQAAVHKKLGDLYMARGADEDAEDSYREAITYGGLASAHVGLGSLLQKKKDSKGAEKAFQKAIKADPKDALGYSKLMELQRRRGAAGEISMLETLRGATKKGAWPVRFIVEGMDSDKKFEIFTDTELQVAQVFVDAISLEINSQATKDCEEEKNLGTVVCQAKLLRAKRLGRTDELPGVLKGLRDLENSTEFAVKRWTECAKKKLTSCRHKDTYFDASLQLFETPAIQQELHRKWPKNEIMTVLGSGLGSLCFYSVLGWGLPCVGYDQLCDSNVAEAAALAEKFDVSQGENELDQVHATFNCEQDAAAANFEKTGILWLNDVDWSNKERARVLAAALPALPDGATIVSYGQWPDKEFAMDGISVDSISKEGSIGAAVSWKESQSIFIFKKKAEVEEPTGRYHTEL